MFVQMLKSCLLFSFSSIYSSQMTKYVLIISYWACTETLVHSTLEPCDDADFTFSVNFNLKDHTVYVRCRPHLRDFMDRVSSLFEIIIFTASQSIYAEQLLNVLDPKRKVFRHRVYRESCVFVDGNYLKDLSVLGRDLAHVIIIDNSPQVLCQNLSLINNVPLSRSPILLYLVHSLFVSFTCLVLVRSFFSSSNLHHEQLQELLNFHIHESWKETCLWLVSSPVS